MKPAPPPRRAVRQAAIQPSTSNPSAQVLKNRHQWTTASAQYRKGYQDWQADAKRFARTVGVARFSANIVASASSRCLLRVENRDVNGDWQETTDDRLASLMDDYSNATFGQEAPELVRLHSWHYQVAGEGAIVTHDGERGVAEWMVVSLDAIDWDKPAPGQATIRLTPGGTVIDGRAFEVNRDLVQHFWFPDEEWLGLATSPMTAAMDDLRRYRSLVRHAQRQADSYLAMNGVLWTPNEAHETDDPSAQAGDPEAAEPVDRVLQSYEDFARIGVAEDDRLESVVPPMWWWDGDKPEWVEIGRPLDEHGIAYRAEALQDWARGVDLPASLVTGGGPGDKNHWVEWLVDEKFFKSSVAPTMDRVCHQDLTVAYLAPRLRLMGITDLSNYRVGYDPTDVIVHPDKSDKALRAWMSGLLGSESTLREMGFDENDLASADDLERLAGVLSAFANGVPGQTPAVPAPGAPGGDGPVTPATTQELAPTGPPSLPTTPASIMAPYLPWDATRPPRANVTGQNGHGRVAASKAAQYADSVMIGLPVPAALEAAPDGEPADTLHMTLVVVPGEAPDLDPALHAALRGVCARAAAECPPPAVSLSHVERFVASGDDGLEPAALVDGGPAVPELRARVVALLEDAGIELSDGHAFRPHVTLGYWQPGDGPEMGPVDGDPLEYEPDGIELHWGQEVTSFPFAGARAAGARRAYNPDQSRDSSGRFGEGGGSSTEPGAGKAEQWAEKGGPVTIELPELATFVNDLSKMTEPGKRYNLCEVSVPGTNIFCGDNQGIAREQMPQFKGDALNPKIAEAFGVEAGGEVDVTKGFLDSLREQGIPMVEETVPASTLKATQMDLRGEKVAGMVQAAEAGKFNPVGEPIVVSSDNYVVDGHHRWAAAVALDAADAKLGDDYPMPVIRVAMPIAELIPAAKGYADQYVAPKAASLSAPAR